MTQFDFKIQRFQPGDPLYSDAKDANGVPACFGQMIDENGKLIMYTLERADMLTDEGTYDFSFMYSPVNKCIVPVFSGIPGRSKIEIHIANQPHELLGCTATGSTINKTVPAVAGSTIAFEAFISLLIGQPYKRNQDELLKPFLNRTIGSVTYETLNQPNT